MPSPELMRTPASNPSLARATVLLVDDESRVTESLELVLRRHVREVVSANSAAQGLACLARQRVHAIVSDQHMPGMAGSDFLAVAARDYPLCARIMLTGRGTLDDAVRAINHGKVCCYLQKPVQPGDLVEALTEALVESDAGSAVPTSPSAFEPGRVATLSTREREIFSLLVEGLRVGQVATTLFISRETVRNHVKAIFQKLDVHSQAELIGKGRGLLR